MGKRRKIVVPHSEKVAIFLQCVEELLERRFVLRGINEFSFHISIDQQTNKIDTTIKEGDIEEFRSFMLTFRKFVLEQEPCNVTAILKGCRGFVKDEKPEIRDALDQARAAWKMAYERGVVRIRSGDINLTPKYVLDLYCSCLFHSDNSERRAELASLLGQDVPAARIQILWSLPILTDVILRISAILRNATIEDAFQFPNA